MKSEHDVFVWRRSFKQSVGDGRLDSIVLNPDFALDDVELYC
jgi:hypothetical protein